MGYRERYEERKRKEEAEARTVGRPKNIGELLESVRLAVEKYGPECEWNGWDDGSIMIYPKKGQSVWIALPEEG